ncbi:MAG: hypothetical protein N2745_11455 [Syntrophorhabdaceae bacterium]|nr:hypothetical protein [Syntrophorhabdaceae bacterium]
MKSALLEIREDIIKACFGELISIYKKEYADFLIKEKDRFLNPVGYTLMEGLCNIFDHILMDGDYIKTKGSLENIMKIIVVNGIEPSKASSFLSLMKTETVKRLMDIRYDIDNIHHVERLFDRISIFALDIYTDCKDKLDRLKSKGFIDPYIHRERLGD